MAHTGDRNKQLIYIANRDGEVPILDSNGYDSGEIEITYSKPMPVRINVSEAKSRSDRIGSSANTYPYGIEQGYAKLLVTCDFTIPFKEDTVLWIENMPELDSEGNTDTPYDFRVAQIRRSLNNIVVAVKKVDLSNG